MATLGWLIAGAVLSPTGLAKLTDLMTSLTVAAPETGNLWQGGTRLWPLFTSVPHVIAHQALFTDKGVIAQTWNRGIVWERRTFLCRQGKLNVIHAV